MKATVIGCGEMGDVAVRDLYQYGDFDEIQVATRSPDRAGQAFGDLRELVRSRPDVRLVFRHFPLDSRCNTQMRGQLHQEACQAAAAAESTVSTLISMPQRPGML